MRLGILFFLMLCAHIFFVGSALAVSDTTAYATPDPPPSLPGRGGTMIDPVFGSTVIQLSDETDSAFAVGHSYSSHYVMNADSTYFIALYNTSAGGGVWKSTPFNPSTYSVGTPVTITAPTPVDPIRWDVSGSRNAIAYFTTTGSGPTARQIYEWDAAAHTSTLVKDFEIPLRRSGTVTTGTDSTHFAASAFVSPVTDMVTHFEVGQVVTFTSGALSGQSQSITAFTDAGGAFTTNAFTGTPGVGDTFYVRPAGFINAFNVSPDGRYFTMGLSQFGGQDTGHILLVWDRTLNNTYVHYFTREQFGGASACPTTCGWHQMQLDKAAGSNYIWTSINSVRELLIDFIAGTVVYTDPTAFGHADTSVDGKIVHTAGVAAQAKAAYNATADPSTLVDVLTTVTKGGLTDNLTGRHLSWSLDAEKILASTYLTPGGLQAVANSKWTADDPPIYRMDNFTTQMAAVLPLTPGNLGEVWDNQEKLTYMGTTKASVVAAGQWAFDPAGSGGNGQLWVRGTADHDMTTAPNSLRISAFDWRLFLDEITLIYTDELPGNTQKWTRLAKAFSRTSGQGASETSWTPRANLSPDGNFAVFTSTWGNRTRRDLFAVVIGAAASPAIPTGLHTVGLASSTDTTLIWAPNTESNLAGYRIYRSTTSGVYGAYYKQQTAASVTATHSPLTQMIDSLPVAGTYYYTVTSYATGGLESAKSSEISVTVAGVSARSPRQ